MGQKSADGQLKLGIDPADRRLNLTAGCKWRDRGIKRICNNDPGFIPLMRKCAIDIARQHGSVTVNDLRAWGHIRGIYPKNPNSWGAIFRDSRFVPIGFDQAAYPQSHARRIIRWGLTKTAKND